MEEIKRCSVKACIRNCKHVYCYSKDRLKRWICFGKYCSMHYERKRKRGVVGKAQSEVRNGEAWLNENGYVKVWFYGAEVYVHRLVDALTHGPLPKGWDVHHKDEDKLNNHWDNLQRMPHLKHMALHGRSRNG